MNRYELIQLGLGLFLGGLLLGLGLGLIFGAPAIALATDRSTYAVGEKVVLFGRGYVFPNRPVIFYVYIDQISENGQVHNVLYRSLTVEPPTWDFAVFWSTRESGYFTAYVTGPDHTASQEIRFQVLVQQPIPEFSGITIVVFSALAASLYLLRRRRK